MGSDMEEIHGITEDPEEDLIPYVGPPKLLPIPLKAVDEDENIIESFDCKLYRLSGGEWKVILHNLIFLVKRPRSS